MPQIICNVVQCVITLEVLDGFDQNPLRSKERHTRVYYALLPCVTTSIDTKKEFSKAVSSNKDLFPPGTQIIEFSPQEKLPFNKTYEMLFVNRFIKMREKLGELERPIIDKIRASKNSEFMPNFQTLLPCVTTSIDT